MLLGPDYFIYLDGIIIRMDGCEFFEFQMHIPFDQRFVYLDR